MVRGISEMREWVLRKSVGRVRVKMGRRIHYKKRRILVLSCRVAYQRIKYIGFLEDYIYFIFLCE